MNFVALDRISTSQLGLITTPQLAGLGATPAWIHRQVRSGRLIPMRRAVMRTAGSPQTQDQAWYAAVLSAGDGAVLSHHSAAAAWGLRGFDPPDHIDVLTLKRAPRLPGVQGHSTLVLPDEHRTRLRRVPVTSAERSLIDASGHIHPWALGRIVDDGLRRKVVTLKGLERTFEEVPVSGRRPSREMQAVLAERVPGFNPGGSAAELDILGILRRAGIDPLPIPQYRVRIEGHTYFLDYGWPATMHALEFDGGGAHDTVSARHDDRHRWRRLQRNGWTVWAITERTDPSEVVEIGVRATGNPPLLARTSR